MILASCLQSKISRNAWVRGRLRRERVTHGEKRSKSAILPLLQLISVNFPRRRTEKTWLWLAGSNQIATNTTNQIPRLSSLRVCQNNWLCAGVFLSLLLFLDFSPVVISLGIIFWLALTLCQYHHPRWRQSSTKMCLLCRLQLSLAGYYQHLRETGSKIADTAYLGGTGYFIFRIAWNLVIKWDFVLFLEMKNINKGNKKKRVKPRTWKHFKPLGNRGGLAVVAITPPPPIRGLSLE